MASIESVFHSTTGPLHGLRDMAARVFRKMAESSQGYACAREAERLNAMSDAELASLGLTRDRIFQHAFARFLAH